VVSAEQILPAIFI